LLVKRHPGEPWNAFYSYTPKSESLFFVHKHRFYARTGLAKNRCDFVTIDACDAVTYTDMQHGLNQQDGRMRWLLVRIKKGG